MKYGLLSTFLASTFAVQSWAQDATKPAVVPMAIAAYHVPTFQNADMVLETRRTCGVNEITPGNLRRDVKVGRANST
jgi:hypothetical protein